MDTLWAAILALLIIVPLTVYYWRKSGVGNKKVTVEVTCPRCGNLTDRDANLCAHCLSPLSVWRGTSHSGESDGQKRPVINASLCIACGACIEACPEQGALAIVSGKAKLVRPDLCKSHGDCVPACPTNGIVLLASGAKQTLRIPATNEEFETNIPGLFVIGEVGGFGLIKTAINEGRRVADTVRRRLGARWRVPQGQANLYEVIVVGAGPAGLSAALSLHSYGVHYLALEQGEIAATIRQYPRNKFLMEEPVELPLFGRLHMNDTTKEALLAVWDEVVQSTGVRIATNQCVQQVKREPSGSLFKVSTAQQVYFAPYVIIATGKRGTPRKLGVPGEDLSKVTYRLIEAESYENCAVAVAGGGDSAVEAALALARDGRNRVALIHRGSDFPRLRERNAARLRHAEAARSLSILRQASITHIHPDSLQIEQNGRLIKLPNQYLFIMIGGESPEDFLIKSDIQIVERVIAD